jgi:HPt (histidine-containing phosphotransfer) domain-containing protein
LISPPRPGSEVTATAQARLQAIYEHACASFARNLATIEAAVDDLRVGALDASGWLAARSAAHRLAGAAGTVGFPEATEPARHLEDAFTDDDLHPDRANLLEAEAAALRKILFGDVPSARAGAQVCARASGSPRATLRP